MKRSYNGQKFNINCIICGKDRVLNNTQYLRNIKCCSSECSYRLRRGKQKSKEHKIKIGLSNLGKKRPPISQETRNKLIIARKKQVRKPFSLETRLKMSISQKRLNRKGTRWTDKTREIIRQKRSGKNNYNWKGGTTIKKEMLRRNYLYRDWRGAVFKRDNWTCQDCGKHGGYLEVHHIIPLVDIVKPFLDIEDTQEFSKKIWELPIMIDVKNGKTVCKPCHLKIESEKKINRGQSASAWVISLIKKPVEK